ncbi:hypothetical protein T4D_14958 [Trichinella pseudospiralis]|uniref:Uncharacterized protein n=1 Tax=Trichinella pseudospiralis TaxID=6337 RepID=A0A0V1FT42_TRIPS|nr:hypothetical protein T4D_2201 [Trichinella pseudospiralis]KRY89193.1 hypothetical protein T4D_14958 [Trichinella pseudospiralis]
MVYGQLKTLRLGTIDALVVFLESNRQWLTFCASRLVADEKDADMPRLLAKTFSGGRSTTWLVHPGTSETCVFQLARFC